MPLATLDTLFKNEMRGKRVLVRADLNVPLDEDGTVRDSTRLERLIPTLKELKAAQARIIIISHFGRPKGQANPDMSLAPIASALAGLLNCSIPHAPDCIGDAAAAAVQTLQNGEICVLENTRFHGGEEKNDADFAKALAELADFYVNDAFSAAHRAHASTHAIAKILPAFAGRSMQAELEALSLALETPQSPVAAIVGGAKISTKLDLLGNLTTKTDYLIIGGGMANTFLAAQGVKIGTSLCETSMLEKAREIMETARQQNCQIILPCDAAIAAEFAPMPASVIADINDIPETQMILDCGPKSVDDICACLDACKTLIWNGPLGAFELSPFDMATNKAAQYAGALTKAGKLVSVAGGGDTVAALNHAEAAADFTYVSTAGGAFLEWLEGKSLPGIAILMNK